MMRIFRAACHAAALALALAGCGRAAAAEPLSLLVSRTPLSLPLYVAQDQGYFAAQGLQVQVADCVGGHRCLRQLLNGEGDIATAGDMPLVIHSFERSDYAVLATMVTSGEDMKLVASTRAGIGTPAQLAGRRIGAVIGSASHYFLELSLLAAGVDPRQLSVVGLQPEEMAAALQGGRVDAVSIWEPYADQVVRALGPAGVVLPGAGAYFETFNLVSHRRLVGRRDAALVRLLAAVEQAERFIQAQPAQAKAILQQRLGLAPALVERLWPGLSFRLALEPALLATMESEARWARREGHVKATTPPNLAALLHAAPLRAVKAGAVTVGH